MRRPAASRCALFGVIASNALFAGMAAYADDLPPPANKKIDFTQDIQPILTARCYECHGPKKQKGDLRLDEKTSALRGGENGPVWVAGKSGDSSLIERVASDEPTQMMPPKGDRLSKDQIGLLRAWIDQGARWPDSAAGQRDFKRHWAFSPPVKPAEPDVKLATWPRNPLDRFVLARLEKEGIAPSPEADRITLLRRLHFDLTGLPPSIEDVDAFISDNSPNAYEKAVEKLLASPHYGERWGRHWLDAARYADSDGFEKDKPRYIWFYRDWVVAAFNRDLPYNQFLVEQLAGDLLENPTQDQIVATGFLRNSMINEEGGVDPEQFRMEAMFDRMDAIGKGMLGLTIQCAQCHSHKYDPLTQEEYYRLFAFLNNDDEPFRVVYTPDQQQAIAGIHERAREVEMKLQAAAPDWREKLERWEDDLAKQPAPAWTVISGQFEFNSTGGQKYLPQKDGSFLAQSYAPTKHTGQLLATTNLKKITAFRIELLNDANLPAFGPGRSFKGTCALTEFRVEAAPAGASAKKAGVKFAKALADFDQPEAPLEPNFDDRSGKKRVTGPVAFAIDGKDDTAWGIDAGPGRRNVPREAVFVLEKPIENENGAELTILLAQNHGGWNSDDLMTNNLGRFRISATETAEPNLSAVPARVREILATPRSQRTPAQVAALFSHWRTTVPDWKDANAEIADLWKQHPEGTTTLVLQARPEARATSVLKRGDFLSPVKPVSPGVPAFLNPLPEGATPNRLALARWMTDPKAPTTARVFVNRVWQSYFGTGLVATSEDFGIQGERPSHPELLDWLASTFMEHGWKVKDLHRLIVNSATYRQSSKVTPDAHAKDPANRLLARGARFRVEGEIVRDIQLTLSGLLNPAIGGKAIMPPAPAFIFQPPASYAPFPWVEETGPNRYRRAIYTWRRRSTPYPMLATFDVPNGDTSCVRRVRSNTPLQALMSLNETMAMEAARALARRILENGGDSDESRIAYAFKRCLSRPPDGGEQKVLLDLLAKQKTRIADGWINPWEIATGGKTESPAELPKGTNPAQLAAYTVVARVLLNLDETITKE